MYIIERLHRNTNSMTFAQAANFYGRPRTRDEFMLHWWNWPHLRARSPQIIYDMLVNQNRSCRWILGWDDAQRKVRILELTPPNRVPLTSHSANIFSDPVEIDPLMATDDPRAYELYKAVGWLKNEYDKEVGKRTRIGVHKQYFATECNPFVKDRVAREAEKHRTGAYNPKPPVVEGAKIRYSRFDDAPRLYKFKRDANLWNFNHKRHADMTAVISFKKGDTISIVGRAINDSVGGSVYLMTQHSFGNADDSGQPAFTNGVNQADLDRVTPNNPPAVEPPKETPVPEPEPVVPEVELTFKKFNQKKYFYPVKKYFYPVKGADEINKWDFNHARHADMVSVSQYARVEGEPIEIYGKVVHPTGSEYYLVKEDFESKTPHGFNKVDLEPTKKPTPEPEPEEPAIPEEPELPETPPGLPPSEDSLDKNKVIAFFELIVNLIRQFIERIR